MYSILNIITNIQNPKSAQKKPPCFGRHISVFLLLLADYIRLRIALYLSDKRVGVLKAILLYSLMHVGFTSEHKEEFSVFRFYGVIANKHVSLKARDSAFTVFQRTVVA